MSTRRQAIRALKHIVANIPTLLSMHHVDSKYRIKNLDDLLNYKDSKVFKKVIGITITEFKDILNRKVFDASYLDKSIMDHYEAEKQISKQ